METKSIMEEALVRVQAQFSSAPPDLFCRAWLREIQVASTTSSTLHQLADVLTDLAAESPPRIAGGLLVAARAMLAYAEGQR